MVDQVLFLAGFIVSRTIMWQRCTCAHGVTPVIILSLSEPCVALTSAVIAAHLARCPADSCKGAVDALQEHCTQDTILDGGE